MRSVLPRLAGLLLLALLAACGGEAPPAPPPPAAMREAGSPPPAAAERLDTAALKARAAAALAANRLYAPAGDNAVEDYLELRTRLGATDSAIETALVDLAPYVVIGAEQATAAGGFEEAARLIGLLARMDAEAPAVPRLREGLAAAQAAALARAQAEAAEAERRAALAAAESSRQAAATGAPVPPAPAPSVSAAPQASVPAAAPVTAAPASGAAATPAPERSAAPATAAVPPASSPVAAAAPRALLSRVQPRFPEAALRRRLEGEVEVLLGIAPDGSVDSVEVLRAEPPGVFDREAVLAARRWRYAPAETRSTVRVVLSFRRPD